MDNLARLVYGRLLQHSEDGDIVHDSEEEARRMRVALENSSANRPAPLPPQLPSRSDGSEPSGASGEERKQDGKPNRSGLPADRFLTVRDVVRLFAVHPATVYRWMRAGTLQAFQPIAGGPWRIPESAVRTFLRRRSAHGVAHA
jgi:excisionase family DNA binding protein